MHPALLSGRAPRRAGAILGAVLLAAAVQFLATSGAIASSRPAVDLAAPEVAGTSVTLAFTVNRAANAVEDAACSVTDSAGLVTPVDCGAAAPGTVRRATTYERTLSDLLPGDYAYDVVVTLTDGGTATGRTTFTVEQPTPVEFATSAATCEALAGGTFVPHASWWQVWSCDFDAATADAGAAASSSLGPLCLADGGVGYAGGMVAPGRYEVSCWLT